MKIFNIITLLTSFINTINSCIIEKPDCNYEYVCPKITEITDCGEDGIDGFATYQLSLTIKPNKQIKNIFLFILLVIGLGFIYKFIFGSNNEIQLNKVFWHDSRLLHGVLYITATYYLYVDNINLNSITLSLDIIFSFLYRFLLNK